eukprot:11075487-Heterocapsa_arctica.AAC.1
MGNPILRLPLHTARLQRDRPTDRPPAGMGPPTPTPSGPFGPLGAPTGPLPVLIQAPTTACPQCPIY